MVKETGAGICAEDGKLIAETGIVGIDVAGAGGTSFAAVETFRAQNTGNHLKEHLGKLFWDWGIPTAISTFELTNSTRLPIISSGGIRDGITITKALALGANAAGLAIPFLQHAMEKNPLRLEQYVEQLIQEIKTTMFLVGAKSIADLRKTDLVITGYTKDWLIQRGLDPAQYAHRS
jgi:isopentenyl-diphosphate delta-isomerase